MQVVRDSFRLWIRPRTVTREVLAASESGAYLATAVALSTVQITFEELLTENAELWGHVGVVVGGDDILGDVVAVASTFLTLLILTRFLFAPMLRLVSVKAFHGEGRSHVARSVVALSLLVSIPFTIFVLPLCFIAVLWRVGDPQDVLEGYQFGYLMAEIAGVVLVSKVTAEAFRLRSAWSGLFANLLAAALCLVILAALAALIVLVLRGVGFGPEIDAFIEAATR